MQRVVGGYLAKRIGDELFAPPPQRAESGPPPDDDDDADRLVLTDDEGRHLGTAYRLPGVAVYVVSDGHGHRQDDLEWCLGEGEGRVFVQREGGRIVGLIYAPTASAATAVAALRAEEV